MRLPDLFEPLTNGRIEINSFAVYAVKIAQSLLVRKPNRVWRKLHAKPKKLMINSQVKTNTKLI